MKLVSLSKRLARLLTPSRTGAALLAVPLLATAIPSAGCGKEDNLHEVVVLDFPHSFPEAPRPLDATRTTTERTGHPLVATDKHLFVLDRDNRELVRLDRNALDTAKSRATPGPERESSLRLGGRPEQLVALDSGDFLITLRTTGEVLRVTPDLEITQRVRLGVDAYGIALSPDGRTAYVTLPMNGELVTLDALTLEELDRAALLDTPRGVTASANNYLLVTQQHGPATRLEVDESGLPLGVINLDLRRGSPAELMSMGRLHILKANRALAVTTHPQTGAAYVAHVAAAPGNPEDVVNTGPVAPGDVPASTDGYGGGSSLGGGAFNVPTRPVEAVVTPTDSGAVFPTLEADFPVQDPKTGEPMTHLVDQPSDIAHHPTWSLLFMTGYGTDNVLVMSTAEGDPMRSPLALIDVGRAPRGIAFSPDGQLAYVLNEHDLTVSVIELARFFDLKPLANGHTVFPDTSGDAAMPVPMGAFAPEPGGRMEFFSGDPTPDSPRVAPFRMAAKAHVAYARDPMPEAVRRGARTFTFSRNESISHAGQFACASCHFEGTEDKLVWMISDGPRQTPALAGRLAGTAPFNWAGSEAELQHNMVQTVDRMGGAGLSPSELADLEQFLLFGLEAPQNPYRSPDGLTADQLAGKAIFESKEAACSSCHMPEREFTDGRSHDVGTASKAELVSHEFARAMDPEARPPWVLDTPSLKGLFYTAPYLHDGSAATLLDVLDRPGSSMGKTSHLTADQKRQLIAYLLTL